MYEPRDPDKSRGPSRKCFLDLLRTGRRSFPFASFRYLRSRHYRRDCSANVFLAEVLSCMIPGDDNGWPAASRVDMPTAIRGRTKLPPVPNRTPIPIPWTHPRGVERSLPRTVRPAASSTRNRSANGLPTSIPIRMVVGAIMALPPRPNCYSSQIRPSTAPANCGTCRAHSAGLM